MCRQAASQAGVGAGKQPANRDDDDSDKIKPQEGSEGSRQAGEQGQAGKQDGRRAGRREGRQAAERREREKEREMGGREGERERKVVGKLGLTCERKRL